MHIDKFNDHLYDFFCQLNEIYPEDEEIKSFKKKIYYGKVTYSTSLCKEFIKNIFPYKYIILKRDESNLMNIDNDFINNIKKYYEYESENNKKVMFDYLIVLIKESEKLLRI